jgi:hypothetical protein
MEAMVGMLFDMALTAFGAVFLLVSVAGICISEEARRNWKRLIFTPICLMTGFFWSALYWHIGDDHFGRRGGFSPTMDVVLETLIIPIPVFLGILVFKLASPKTQTS